MNFSEIDDDFEDTEQGKGKAIISFDSYISIFVISDIKLDITKKSKKLGRAVEWSDQAAVVLEELQSDPALADTFIIRRSSTRATQYAAYSYISHVSLNILNKNP